MLYVFNGAIEVAQADGSLELRCAELGQTLEASPYQVGLLRSFKSGDEVEAVLREFPFERAASAAFLQACIDKCMLLPLDAQGQVILPLTRRVTPTIFGAPQHRVDKPAAFTFLGVPYDLNTTGRPGTRFGPAAIRLAAEGCSYSLDPVTFAPVGFADMSSGRRLLQGVQLADAGDVFISTGEPAEDVYDRITRSVRKLLDTGTIPIVLGGDHSISYPVLRAFDRDNLQIVHFDAHTDLGEVSSSGLHHGNVFSVVLEKLENIEGIHQFGLRGLMNAQTNAKVERVDQYGMDEVRADLLGMAERIPSDGPCYLTIDIDVVDPAFAPSTGTPVANGLFPHELKRLVHDICSTHEVIGIDIVEVGPPESPADGTGSVALEAAVTACDAIVQFMLRAIETEGDMT